MVEFVIQSLLIFHRWNPTVYIISNQAAKTHSPMTLLAHHPPPSSQNQIQPVNIPIRKASLFGTGSALAERLLRVINQGHPPSKKATSPTKNQQVTFFQ
jgi:hypothetical protein